MKQVLIALVLFGGMEKVNFKIEDGESGRTINLKGEPQEHNQQCGKY